MIRLRLFGSIELTDAAGLELTAVLLQPRRFALLAYLSAVGGYVRRDTLLAMFWPELDEAHARSALNQAVRFLRKSLGAPDAIVSRGAEDVAVSAEHVWCDVAAFRRALDGSSLDEAVNLYRGDLLSGFHCGGAPEFDEWLDRERRRWRAEAASAARTLATAHERAEFYSGAVRVAHRALELASADERSVRELLSLLDRLGDRAGAMQAYEAFVRRLANDAEVEPAPETQALVDDIRARAGPLNGGAPVARAVPLANAAGVPDVPEPPGDKSNRPAPIRRVATIMSSVGALVLTAFVVARGVGRGPDLTPALSDSVLAIAPFDALGAGTHSFWREGLVDVLAANLDGAGPIRTVSASLAIRRWTGRGDPASAEEFGHRLRARFVVFGRILGSGHDSLRVFASLYDVKTRTTIDALDLTNGAQHMDRLADSVSLRLLHALSIAGAADRDRLASFGTTSGAALKEFLRGEQFYRRAEWDSALKHDTAALSLDPAFPVALARVHRILAFHQRSGTRPDSFAWDLARRAGEHNHGLAPRESLLVLRDSLVFALHAQENDPQWWTHQRRRVDAMRELTRRYPDDPIAWQTYGGELSGASVLGVPEASALAALDRAIALDSSITSTYVGAYGLALRTRGPEKAARYAEAFLARTPSGADAERLRLLTWVAAHPKSSPAAAGRLLDSASVAAIRRSAATLTDWPDSAESGIWLARTALKRAAATDSAAAIETLARALASRGHVVEAFAVDPTEDEWAFAEYALAGSLPADTIRARYARILRDARPTRELTPRGSVHRIVLMVPFTWWAATGDTVSLQRSRSLAERFARQTGAQFGAAVWRYVAAAADAHLALARRDSALALARFLALPDTLCPWCKYERLQTAQLLAAARRWPDAYAYTQRGLRSSVEFDGVSRVWWALAAARAAEGGGRDDEARDKYGYVAAMWRFADAPLRRAGEDARRALDRLNGRSSRSRAR